MHYASSPYAVELDIEVKPESPPNPGLIETMKGNTDIWCYVLEYLGDRSVASVGETCRMLYPAARHVLKLRVGHYLRSKNAWEHGFYPARGYYGTLADGDSNELEHSMWVECSCEHHMRLNRGLQCTCGLNRTRKESAR